VTLFVSKLLTPGKKVMSIANSKREDNEMTETTLRTVAIRETIKASLGKIPGIRCAFVFGTFAKREPSPGASVDLIVIGGPDLEEMEEVVSGMEKKVGRPICVYSFTLGEFREKVKLKERFVKKALSAPKIMLIGDVNNL
jgi:predicted nucleotidyltransferase